MKIEDKNLATGSSPPPAPSTAPTESRSTSPAFEDFFKRMARIRMSRR